MKQLKSRQVCFFLIAFLPITKFFSLPSIIAGYASEDLWISALICLLLDFITLIPIVMACKSAKKNFFELLEDNFGKVGAKLIATLYFIFFFVKTILPLNEQKDYIEFTLYTLKPTVIYFLPLFLLAFYICFKKLRVYGRLADVLWMITLNGFITLFVLSIPNADFSAILPVGARGFSSILKGSLTAFNWFNDSVFIMFFIGEFDYDKKTSLKIFLSFVLGAVMVVLFMITFYAIFASIAFRQRFALTEMSKYTTVISNLGRFDYIGIFMILFSNVFALCLPIYFSSKLIKYIFNIKRLWIAPAITVGLQLFIVLFLYEFSVSFERIITNYFSFYFILLGNVLPIILSIIFIRRTNYATKKG